ncbi:MAG: hypothetical protein ACKOQ1_02980, partial [Actinomycetota bacterium]
WRHEDHDRPGVSRLDLFGSVQLDLEHDVAEKIIKIEKLPEDELVGLEAEAAEIFGESVDAATDASNDQTDEQA